MLDGNARVRVHEDGRVTMFFGDQVSADVTAYALQNLGVKIRQYGKSLVLHNDPNTEYPRVTEDGRTVWACCESSIGPICEHLS